MAVLNGTSLDDGITGTADDLLNLNDYYGGTHLAAMGIGNDIVRVGSPNGTALITLGAGRDRVELSE